MFETLGPSSNTSYPGQTSAPLAVIEAFATFKPAARGSWFSAPDRAAATTLQPAWLTRMLDEVDYGMLLVSTEAKVLYMNHAARFELDAQHPLQLVASSLRAQRPQDVAPLYAALAAAQQGLRRLVHLGAGAQSVTVSVVPQASNSSRYGLADGSAGAGPGRNTPATEAPTLLVLGKRQVCAPLTVQAYATSVALTPTETRVLQLLCDGLLPAGVAKQQNVAVSTVRTQIGAIRFKTGTNSIRDLVRRVALLPPLVGALRAGLAR